jgi:hypothetical protein
MSSCRYTIELRCSRPLKTSRYLRQSRPFWTATKILLVIVAVVLTILGVRAGMYYLPARQSTPLCQNSAANYPSCDYCGSLGQLMPATQSCACTNGATNPPTCNKVCANGAINPPSLGNPRGCDQCPDGRTVDYGVPCPQPRSLPVGTANIQNYGTS